MQPTSAYATDALISKETLLIIEAKAAVDFPNDYSKQEDVIKAQTTAYAEIKNYKNENVPVKILENLKIKAARNFPLDYRFQLSIILQQVNSDLKLSRYSLHSIVTDIEKCEDLKWRLGNKGGQEYYYWGTLKPGSADVIYVVGLFGQNFGFPNPDGTWEITVWDDYKVENTRREKFACEKY